MRPEFRSIVAIATLAALTAACADPQTRLKDARACLQKRDLPCAELNLKTYLKRYDHDARDTALLAIILTQERKHLEAIDMHKKATDLGVADPQLVANYATSLEATGDIPGAITWNRKALELDPTLVDVAATTARQLNQTGHTAEAVSVLTNFDAVQTAHGQPAHFAALITTLSSSLTPAAPTAPDPSLP